jgi:hypothetical protein
VTLCGHRPAAPLLVDAAYGALKADFESEAYFGSGWGDSERTPTGRVRRATGPATLLLPLTSGRSYRFSLDLAGAPGRIDLLFNDTSLGSCEPGGRNESCDVQLPSALVRDGVNALTLRAAPSPASDGPWLTFQGARIAPIE